MLIVIYITTLSVTQVLSRHLPGRTE